MCPLKTGFSVLKHPFIIISQSNSAPFCIHISDDDLNDHLLHADADSMVDTCIL